MMRFAGAGRFIFALCFVAIGAIGIGAHDFVLNQQPVPKDIPMRETLATMSGALLLLAGAGLFLARTAKISALLLTGFLATWVLALWLPKAVAQPFVEGQWLGVGEVSTLAAGGWLIYCAISGRNDASVKAARILFGAALIPIGLSHFVYLTGAAELIPSWMPFRIALTCFTGAMHIAAGLAIATGSVARLASTLEAAMESLITVICWLPAVANAPADRMNWVNLFISTALSAAAWALAGSYRNASDATSRTQAEIM